MKVNYSPSILLQALIVIVGVNLISQAFSFSAVIGSVINWFFFASLLFLTAYIFVLSGNDYWRTIALLAFANIPLVFLAPLKILSITNPIISAILQLAVSLWIFNLNIIAISEICSISKKKTVLLYLIPPLAIAFIFIGFLINLISQIAIMI